MTTSKGWNWDQIHDIRWSQPSEELFLIAKRWKRAKKKKVLDLGAGTGRNSVFLTQQGFIVFAMDISSEGMEILNKKCIENEISIDIEVADMLLLPYEDSFFDAVVAFHVVYHTDRAGIEKTISEIHRVLNKEGEIYLTFNAITNPSFRDPSNKRIDDFTVIKTTGIEKDVPHYYVDEAEIRRIMKDFDIIRIVYQEVIELDNKSCHYFVLAKKFATMVNQNE